MNRLTRPLNSFNSILNITPRIQHLTVTSTVKSHLQPFIRRREWKRSSISTSLAASSRRRMADSSDSTANLSGSAIDDFVTVENPANEDSFISVDDDAMTEDSTSEEGGSGDGGGLGEFAERSIPEEILRKLVILSCENVDGRTCNVYMVGTAHVSQESCREVQAVISCLKPQVVFLELCSSRVSILTLKDLKIPTMTEMIDMWKKKQNFFGILYSWFLAKVADELEVLPGSEFRVAFEEAVKYGCKVILGDRPVQITLRRTWGKMPLWHKIKLMYSIFFQAVFLPSPDDLNRMLKELDDVDMLTLVIQEMSKQFPILMETIVNERDRYMSSTLLRVAKEHTSVIAVVGKGHLQGIKSNWEQPVEIDELLEVPIRRPVHSAVKVLTAVGVAVAGTAIVSGIYLATKKQS